ncbi:phage tail protein [Enterobacter sp. CGMCC 5087]|uniref:phage tail protein n=1 Tax=Enterobacter sp. CGMCC 5087 TaxID=2183878 RepID=UPI000D6811D8|nr:phage tail protein [Enterobacter sp. CGMCC 5087]PWI80493.1 phage tail protein [Enterobacter sp. CGMCC 5087]
MLKVDILREHLNKAIPWVRSNPDNLETRVRKGNVVSSGRPGASFEYRYHVDVLAMDFPDDIEMLTLVILTWARDHQPDLIFNPDKRAREVSFDADILDNGNVDVLFSFPVSEAVTVTRDSDGRITFTPQDEPDYRKMYGISEGVWDLEFDGTMTDDGL